MRKQSLSRIPWFQANKTLIYCALLLLLCNIVSFMVLFQEIEKRTLCNEQIASFQTFVEPGHNHLPQQNLPNQFESGLHQPLSPNQQIAQKEKQTQTQINENNNNDPKQYINPNPKNSNKIKESNTDSIQNRLEKETKKQIMPFQRYKQVSSDDDDEDDNNDITTNIIINNKQPSNNERKDKSPNIDKTNTNTNKSPQNEEFVDDNDGLNDIPKTEALSKYTINSNNLPKYNIISPKELGRYVECPNANFITIFNNLLSILKYQRKHSYFPNYYCPHSFKIEFRPNDLKPHVLGNECAPGWPSDIIFILSRLLNKNMIGIQYGHGVSSMWLSLFINQLYSVDTRADHVDDFMKKVEKTDFDLSNLRMQYMRMSKQYVHQVDPQRGRVVDLIVMDTVPTFHDDILKYAVSVLKENNGILLLRYDWFTPDSIEKNITQLIPSHWIRYNSDIPKEFIETIPFSQEKYIENARTSLWISNTFDKVAKNLGKTINTVADPCQI